MSIETLREKSHDYINIADEQHLSAIFVLLGGDMGEHNNIEYDTTTMEELYKHIFVTKTLSHFQLMKPLIS